ncbi:hypothetical protein MKW92_028593, partial [Papaver armeniacum]
MCQHIICPPCPSQKTPSSKIFSKIHGINGNILYFLGIPNKGLVLLVRAAHRSVGAVFMPNRRTNRMYIGCENVKFSPELGISWGHTVQFNSSFNFISISSNTSSNTSWRKKIPLCGLVHPVLFSPNNETSLNEFSFCDFISILGAVHVSPRNLYRLLSNNSFILLYPGGAREALHCKGEECKCFWPDRPEFVKMAAKFGATIIPFGVVGEDDITQGEVAKQDMFVPGVLAKIPGRFYYLFGKPIETKGMEEEMKDKDNANAMYLKIKSEKREKDPYRGIVERTIYKAMKAPTIQVPTFEL